MTDRASTIKRELNILITQQIVTLRQEGTLNAKDLREFHVRSVKLDALFRELDQEKPKPALVHRRKLRIHAAA